MLTQLAGLELHLQRSRAGQVAERLCQEMKWVYYQSILYCRMQNVFQRAISSVYKNKFVFLVWNPVRAAQTISQAWNMHQLEMIMINEMGILSAMNDDIIYVPIC
jgi:hypothetical protein